MTGAAFSPTTPGGGASVRVTGPVNPLMRVTATLTSSLPPRLTAPLLGTVGASVNGAGRTSITIVSDGEPTLRLAGFAAFAAWRGLEVLMESIEFQSVATNPLQTPLWQPQLAWFVGLALFALISLLYALHALVLLVRGSADLNRMYGPASAQDELEAELTARAEREAQDEAKARP